MMKKKKCSKCGELKPLDEFYKDNKSSDGHCYICKTCKIKRNRQRRIDNLTPEEAKRKEQNRKRRMLNKILLKKGQYICMKCRKIKPLTEYSKKVAAPHGHSYTCKDCDHKRGEEYRDNIKKDTKRLNHRRKIKKKYYSANLKDDPQFKLNRSISRGIYYSLKGNKNGRHWEDFVGYTLDELRQHLERQFTDKMTWQNQGSYWHVDHIIPQSAFTFTKPEHIEFKRCWSLDNLQPLEAKKNMSKNDKLIKDKQEYLTI